MNALIRLLLVALLLVAGGPYRLATAAIPAECRQAGFTCIRADADYWSQVSSPPGPFRTGSEACKSIEYTNYFSTLSAGSWGPAGSGGPACSYTLCYTTGPDAPRCQPMTYGGWVLGRQNCKPTLNGQPVYTEGLDPTDQSVAVAGRNWCAYKNAPSKSTPDPRPNAGGPGPGSGGGDDNGGDDPAGFCSTKSGGSGGTSSTDTSSSDGEQFGSPIQPGTGDKIRDELDWSDHGASALEFRRFYRSGLGQDQDQDQTRGGALGLAGLSRPWSHNHAWLLDTSQVLVSNSVTLTNPRGYRKTYSADTSASSNGAWRTEGSADNLESQSDGSWRLHRGSDDATLVFNVVGRLASFTDRAGHTTSYRYNGSRLESVINPYGRTLALSYNAADQLVGLTTPDGRTLAYGYDPQGRLVSVTYPDGKSRGFVYEDSNVPWGLTGLIDEAGQRFATFSYDANQRAIATELGGGLYRFSVNYRPDGAADVTDPLGTTRSYAYGTAANRLVVTSGSMPSASRKRDAASRQQDVNGRVTTQIDFAGVRTETSWDPVRVLPVSEIRAAGRSEAKTITTQWHPVFALPVQRNEPGRTTSWTYDAQGHALTRTVADSAAGTTRTWHWSYTADGLLAAETTPDGAVTRYDWEAGNLIRRTNAAGHVTTWHYDAANRITARIAPNGSVTQYAYDARDRIIAQSLGTGSGTAQVTRFSYMPFGELATLASPSGLITNYNYDSAHRLTGWSNNRGESAAYTLDAMGNRRTESVSGNGVFTIARTINAINRVDSESAGSQSTESYRFDANGELAGSVNALGQSTSFGLDGLRRLTSLTDQAGNQANIAYDGLDSVTGARDFKGVLTTYRRDAQGNTLAESSSDIGAIQASFDAAGLPQRIVDTLGRATDIARDPIGRPVVIRYADNTQTLIRYDGVGPAFNSTGSMGGLASGSTGFVSEIQDPEVTTRFQRDPLGRIVAKTQTIARYDGGRGRIPETTWTVSYAWVPNDQPGAGQLAAIRYPSGHVLGYQYDPSGRISSMTWQGHPLVTNLAWTALGQPTAWQWASVQGSAGSAMRNYDPAGHLIQSELGSYVWDAAGRLVAIRQNLLAPQAKSRGHARPEIAPLIVDTSFGYDPVGRLNSVQHVPVTAPALPEGLTLASIVGAPAVSYAYDANGNRSQAVYEQPGIERLQRDFALDPAHNRLVQITQTRRLGNRNSNYVRQSVRTFSWSAAGELLGDGRLHLTYDAAGRLTQASEATDPTSYTYNRLGQRVRKVSLHHIHGSPRAESSVYGEGSFGDWPLGQYAHGGREGGDNRNEDEGDENGDEERDRAPGNLEYLYLPTASGPMPIAMQLGRDLYAIHTDHLNTPRRLSARNGQTVWQWVTSGFGEVPATTLATGFVADGPLLRFDQAPAIRFDLRYPGQVFDAETGWHYNHHRYYDPTSGRYVSADPIGLAGGWNRFGYASFNVLSWTDATGLDATRVINTSGGRGISDGPTNGNWGGGCWSGGQYSCNGNPSGNLPPTDSGDICYMNHDFCYDKCDASGEGKVCKKSCDVHLIEELKNLSEDSRKWPFPPAPGTEFDSNTYRAGALFIFK